MKKKKSGSENEPGQRSVSAVSIGEQQVNPQRLNALLKAVIEQSPVPMALFSADQQIEIYNQACVDFHGITPEELHGKKLAEIAWTWKNYTMDGQFIPPAETPIAKALRGIPTHRTKLKLVDARGVTRYCITEGVPIRDSAGNILGGFIIFPDITEQHLAETALKQSEARLVAVLEHLLEGILAADTETERFVFANAAICRMLGRSREEIIGLSIRDIHPADALPRVLEEFARMKRGESDMALDLPALRRDGSVFHVDIRAANMELDGRPCVLAMFTDITDRKRAQAELKEAERRYRDLFAGSRDGFVVVSASGAFLDANPAYCNMLGYTLDELKQLEDFYAITPPQWRAWEKKEIWENRLLSQGYSGVYEKEYIRKDGTVFPVELQSFAVFDEGGRPQYLWGVARDITDRKRLEQEQEKLQKQLQHAQKMESVGRLAGGVAHDFNNMLGVILGHTEMALSQVDADSPLQADLQEIRKAAERSADLTRQLLAFARKQTISPQVLDLNATVEGMLKMLRRLIGEDIELAWLPGAQTGQIRLDPSQVDQVLANLCVNARDAIGERPGRIVIETGAANFDAAYCAEHVGFIPGEYILLAVSDNGCGMDKDTQAHLFEPFFTTKESGKGTGLGLATVYGIVKQNCGFINVYSELGKGTTFKIFLPRCRTKATRLPQPGAAETSGPGNATILLVEDEPAILQMTTSMLESQGYQVLAATTPGEAIRLAREYTGPIHLLMTDVVMPEMNGRDLAKNLLAIYPDLKRLFMSGYTANVIAHHGVLDAGVRFLQKPFSLRELSAKIAEALAEK